MSMQFRKSQVALAAVATISTMTAATAPRLAMAR